MKAPLIGLFSALILAGSLTGRKRLERGRQLGAYVQVQSISTRAQQEVEAGRPFDLETIVSSVDEGIDPWGHEILYHLRPNAAGGFDYLVVCVGFDGALDVEAITEYYDADFRWVGDDPDKDIVFRNGESLRDAGKDPTYKPSQSSDA